jgi:hypothetical protein
MNEDDLTVAQHKARIRFYDYLAYCIERYGGEWTTEELTLLTLDPDIELPESGTDGND